MTGRRVAVLVAMGLAGCLAPAAGAAAHAGAPDRGARATHPSAGAVAPVVRQLAAQARTAASGGAVVHNFNGVSSRDSAITNFGAEFEPPDQGLCVGNGFLLEPVNSAFRIYRTDGTSLAGPTNVNAIFGDGFRQFTTDPRCHYDPATGTWFAVIAFLNDTFTAGRVEIAVRRSPDPRGPWRTFKINVTHPGGTACPCFGDQPLLGIDAHNVYVSTNEFSILKPRFNGAQLYVVDKSDLVAGAAAPRFVHIGPLHADGALAGSVQPAITVGPSNAEYFMSSLDNTGQGDHRIVVWALTHRDLHAGVPRLTKTVIDSQHYAVPPPTRQLGAPTRLDSGDDRMQQVQAIGGRLWGELGTALRMGATGPRLAAAAWFEVLPSLHDGHVRAHIRRQGYVASPGNGVLYPAIAGDRNGNAVMGFSVSGAGMYPSAGFARIGANVADFGPVRITGHGTGPYSQASERWGDYSWAVLDPAARQVWLANEYIPPPSSQTLDGEQNWGTRVYAVRLPG